MKSLSFAVLALRDFRLMLLARIFGIMALQAQDVIIGWQIYSLTHDPFMLGLVGLTEAVPAIVCALVAGHIVDISRPHRILLLCTAALAINLLVLLLVAGGIAVTPDKQVLPWLFGCIFISGMIRSFIMPSSFSLLPQVVERAQIPQASAWMSSGFQVSVIVGPVIAGLVYGGYGALIAWTIPISLMVLSAFIIAGMSKPKRHYRSSEKREAALVSIYAGWKFILESRTLLAIMTLDMFAVLFGGAISMLPAYANVVLGVGSEGLGILRTAPAIGAIVTAVILAVRPFKVIRATYLLWAVVGFGASIIGFGLSKTFLGAMLCLIISGAFDSVSMVIRGTLVQLLTPDSMRGRVSAVNSMFIISSNEIGAFESGATAKLLGLVPSIIFGGFATLAVAATTAWTSPKFRKLAISSHN